MDQFEEVYLPTVVGTQSLIGVSPQRPCSWGNYFWIPNPDPGAGSIRILNMWAENLEEARKRFLPDGKVKVLRYGNRAIVIDDRIPDEWLYNKLCFTGGGGIDLDAAFVFYSILGDPTNELEQFIDKDSYYAKRGATVTRADGYCFISYTEETREARERYQNSLEFKEKGFYADFNQ